MKSPMGFIGGRACVGQDRGVLMKSPMGFIGGRACVGRDRGALMKSPMDFIGVGCKLGTEIKNYKKFHKKRKILWNILKKRNSYTQPDEVREKPCGTF